MTDKFDADKTWNTVLDGYFQAKNWKRDEDMTLVEKIEEKAVSATLRSENLKGILVNPVDFAELKRSQEISAWNIDGEEQFCYINPLSGALVDIKVSEWQKQGYVTKIVDKAPFNPFAF